MQFTKIVEEQYENYCQTSNINVSDFVDDEIFDTLSKDYKKIESLLPKIKNAVDSNNWEKFSNDLISCIKAAEVMVQKMKTLPIYFGIDKAVMNSASYLKETELLKIEQHDDMFKIVFRDLLPRRMKNGNVSENLDYLRNHYYTAFENFFSEKRGFCKYTERVVLIYKNYYANSKEVIDDDNFDIKLITDFISQYMLIDDNPVRCMKLFDYGYSDKKHSEIWIYPVSSMKNYKINVEL